MDQVDETNKKQQGLEELLEGFSTFMQNNQATALATAEKEKKEKAEKEEKDKEEKEKKEQKKKNKDKDTEKIEMDYYNGWQYRTTKIEQYHRVSSLGVRRE